MEIPEDQQERIDTYMQTGEGLNTIILHTQIYTLKYLHLFEVIRESGGPTPVAIDLPHTRFGGSVSRDEWMSRSLLALLPGKILVVVGNLHIFKKLEFQEHVPNKHLSIREYIQQEKPYLRMWSVGQLIDEHPEECDFFRRYSSFPGSISLDVDERHSGWKLQYQYDIAILPTECFELVDGVIVY